MSDVSFFSADFMPHGHCYFWTPGVLWTHVVSDAVIALSYYSIPVVLFVFARKRKDLAFSWIFVLFGLFILACGTNHVIDIWTTWSARYGIEGIAKAATATISLITAGAMWPLLPKALAMPSPAQLSEANEQLLAEVTQRREAERQLLELNEELDQRVQERTAALDAQTTELRRSNRDLEQFAYAISHDLKSPLRGVAQLADWLSEDYAEKLGDGEEHLELIRQRVRRMADLIQAVLDYSRGSSPSAREAVNVVALAHRIVDDLVVPTGIEIEIDESIPDVYADEAQVLQVLQNLITNAVMHMGVDHGKVSVTGVSREGRVEIEVADTGPGIATEHHERVFKMFQTLKPAPPGSTGIGLALVTRIVEGYGGTASVESDGRDGSVFRVDLPGVG